MIKLLTILSHVLLCKEHLFIVVSVAIVRGILVYQFGLRVIHIRWTVVPTRNSFMIDLPCEARLNWFDQRLSTHVCDQVLNCWHRFFTKGLATEVDWD